MLSYIGLSIVTGFVAYCNVKLPRENCRATSKIAKASERSYWFGVVGAICGCFVLLSFLWVFNLPSWFAATKSDILVSKKSARIECLKLVIEENFDLARDSANAMQNNPLQNESLEGIFARLFDLLFFKMGNLTAIVPFLAVMAIEIAGQLQKKPLMKNLPTAHDWDILIPLVNWGVAFSWATQIIHSIWLQDRQSTNCLLMSNYWYTYLLTNFSIWMILASVHYECSTSRFRTGWINRRGRQIIRGLGGWLISHVLFGLVAVRSSQKTLFDNLESEDGVLGAAIALPFAGILALLVLLRSQSAFKETAGAPSCGCASFEAGDVCKSVSKFKAESDTEISVQRGEVLSVVTGKNLSGWIEVQSSVGEVGFIPFSYVKPTTDSFEENHKESGTTVVKHRNSMGQQPSRAVPKLGKTGPKTE